MNDTGQICRRCQRPVASEDFDVFEQMHYVCFHYEFEHGDTDVDAECNAGGCPSRSTRLIHTLSGWVDWPVAALHLARSFGIVGRPDNQHVAPATWADNRELIRLHDCLVALADVGLLERREAPDEQFRWARRSRNEAS